MTDTETPSVAQQSATDTFELDDPVTVLHGFGRVRAGERHWVDNTLFVNGVARGVPYRVAKLWRQKGLAIHILASDADEADFAKVSGIQLMAPEKLAAMLSASDLDAIFNALGDERALGVIRGLNDRLSAKHGGNTTNKRRTIAAG